MRTRDADILIVPGLGNSGEDHWQTRWQAKLPTARRVAMPSWSEPDAAGWTAAVRDALPPDGPPAVVIAHSLGVIATVRAVSEGAGNVAGLFLVAAPSEDAVLAETAIDPAFVPYPRARLPCPTTLVASRSDPYDAAGQAKALARDWGATLIEAGEAGHINAASGHGPWPEGLMSFAGFMARL